MITASVTKVLEQSYLFADINEEELQDVARGAIFSQYDKDEIIIEEGTLTSRVVYIIIKGAVRIIMYSASGKAFIVDIRRGGETFFDAANLNREPCHSTVQAMEHTEIIGVGMPEFLGIIKSNPEIYLRILGLVSERVSSAYGKLLDLAVSSAYHRLITVLATLASKYGNTLLLSRQNIADMSGTSMETTSRMMAKLIKAKIIRRSKNKVIILDRAKLMHIRHNFQQSVLY